MRRMSFNLTQPAIRERRKTVTRRLGWRNLGPGERLLAVDRLRVKAIDAKVLGVIEVVSVRREPLSAITCADVIAEGVDLPDCSRHGPEVMWPCPYCFIGLFCDAMRLDDPDTEVTRIEFRYVDPLNENEERTEGNPR